MDIELKELIEKCQLGHKEAQYALVKKYSPMLMAICLRYSRDYPAAQDALQEAFIRIFRFINKLSHTDSVEAWMRTIATRASLQWIDKKYFKSEVSALEDAPEVECNASISGQLNVKDLLKVINDLPVGFRTVFNLYEIEGYSHKEISELIHISESTSRSHLRRAKIQLRKKLELYYKISTP